MQNKEFKRHIAYEVLTILGTLALLLFVCRLWPILLLVILGIFIAAMRLLFLSARKVENIPPLLPAARPEPTDQDIRDMAFGSMQSSFINILGRLDEDVWEDSTTHEKRSAMVVILDEIEYCSSGGGKQKTEEAGEQPRAAAAPAKSASNGEMPGNFTGFEPFGGVNSVFDE